MFFWKETARSGNHESENSGGQWMVEMGRRRAGASLPSFPIWKECVFRTCTPSVVSFQAGVYQ